MDTVDFLMRDVHRANGFLGKLVEMQNYAVTAGHTYPEAYSEFESLRGPDDPSKNDQEKEWVYIEFEGEFAGWEQIDKLFGSVTIGISRIKDFKMLESWYFDKVDKLRALLEKLIENAEDGHSLTRQELYDISTVCFALDDIAMDAGWEVWEDKRINGKLTPVCKDMVTRLSDEFEKADKLTVEAKQDRFRKEAESRMSHLIDVGVLNRDGSINDDRLTLINNGYHERDQWKEVV